MFSKFFGRFFEKRQLLEDKPEVLIFGLGNPGVKYSGTRHNIGFCVIDELCAELRAFGPVNCCESEVRMARTGTGNVKTAALVKPQTYMNLSGDAVKACMSKCGLSVEKCLVIVDDFNIPLGKIRFRRGGTHGGHNGLKSIEASAGSKDFPRLRVGIGPLPEESEIIDFVLGRFEERELTEVRKVVKVCAEAIIFALENGIDTAMNKYN
ncbi:MAG: aminoacyl-tRNA hydrolase [Chitinispirillales bacterium]|nr:aminoacyl-tRNA hydrolase [Chitinispirillales bacterium]